MQPSHWWNPLIDETLLLMKPSHWCNPPFIIWIFSFTGYTGTTCDTNINFCANSPCLNNATCTDLTDRYLCQCLPGYTGTECQTEINECLSNPCIHGTCFDEINGYTCACPNGYTGTNCHLDVRECDASPCQNGGTCVELIGSYKCNCLPGFTGDWSLIDLMDWFKAWLICMIYWLIGLKIDLWLDLIV